jgi:hypothetical protein
MNFVMVPWLNGSRSDLVVLDTELEYLDGQDQDLVDALGQTKRALNGRFLNFWYNLQPASTGIAFSLTTVK